MAHKLPDLLIYLVEMPSGINNNKPNDDIKLYFEGVTECLNDEEKNKYTCVGEITNLFSLLYKKTVNDLQNYSSGHFSNNHVLLDVLILYKKYYELDDNGVYGANLLSSYQTLAFSIFKLFSLFSNITVILPSVFDPSHKVNQLLKFLLDKNLIQVQCLAPS